MIERLEVVPGDGTVIRFGSVSAWADPSASPSLLSFLTQSARNLATSPAGGTQLADHLEGVLRQRDPEPEVAFAVVGPSPDGWTALLHGAVQIWDGLRWVVSDPATGWRREALWPQPSIAVGRAGGAAPVLSPDSLYDLAAGVVPGGGLVLVPTVPARPATASTAPPAPAAPPAPDEPAPAAPPAPDAPPTPDEPSPEAAAPEMPAAPEAAATDAPADRPSTGGAEAAGPDAPPGVTRLSGPGAAAPVAYPPLPPGGTPGQPVPGAPVVAGARCPRGHLNRPGLSECVRCGRPLPSGGPHNVTGTRPALGCLVVDDGRVVALDTGYLVGSEPDRDPTVRGRLARPLLLAGADVSASHAEIRLQDWDVVVTDRASAGGTFVYEPDSTSWQRLRPYETRVLRPGTHVAFAQRVITFVTPWVGPGPR